MRKALPLLLVSSLCAQDFAALADQCGSQIQWIDDPMKIAEAPRVRGASRRAPVKPPEIDRVATLTAACELAREQSRLVLWYVYRVEGQQMYRAPVVADYMESVLFTDPELVALIQRKFVPLRMYCDRKVGQPLGLVSWDFVEPALVFVRPDGTVAHKIDRIRTFSADWMRDLCRQVLAANSRFNAPSEATRRLAARKSLDPSVRLDQVASMIADGDDPVALAALDALIGDCKDAQLARLHLLRGMALRHLRQGEEAVAALDLSLKEARDDEARAMALAELGRVRLHLMDLPAAARDLERSLELAPAGARAPEAGYLRALVDLWSRREGAAIERMKAVASGFPQSPWAWKAATNLAPAADTTPRGAALHGFETWRWLPSAAYATPATGTGLVRPEASAEALAREAVAFLLQQQRQDGGFTDARYAYWPNEKIIPNVWVAITALAASALMEWRELDPARIDAAVAAAEAFCLDEKRMARGTNEDVYVDSYKLQHLTRKVLRTEDGAARQELVARMNEIVTAAATRQNPAGFFGHEYPNPFATGAILWSLLGARQNGATVPNEVVDRALSALQSVRTDNGAYAYGAGRKPKDAMFSLKDSMARNPMCEANLLAFGRSDREKVQAAIANYWKYWDRIEKIRKCDFHTDGELGGFFFWHGFFHTTEANKTLTDEERKRNCEEFLKRIRLLPEVDGSFIDSHELGKSYGTAMGLLSLKNAAAGS